MTTPLHTILTVKNLSYRFESGAPTRASKPALLHNLSFNICNGVTLISGDEQTGKTTLLRVLANDLQASAGELILHKNAQGICEDICNSQPQAYKQHVFFVNPNAARSPTLNNETPSAYFALVQGLYPTFDTALLDEVVTGLSLPEHLHKSVYMLSAGTKRKVWLAAAFASGAALTLLDEPFAALDLVSIRFVKTMLNDANLTTNRAILIADYALPEGVKHVISIHLGA